ncbi:MAG: XTP/dITP diphosphatase [Deltaproteobacteria bacterium]|nr:XTP/dITP diphosphatase [Deltaproteobacteria bacterium]
MKLVVATQNQGKLKEIQKILNLPNIQIVSLADYSDLPQLQEPHQTYVENAREKAKIISQFSQEWTLADDSGLEVLAIDRRPGVFSARYAGKNASDLENNLKLLEELKNIPLEKRQAEFVCCLVLRHSEGREFIAEGRLSGLILDKMQGEQGFGYDPLFYIPDRKKVLADMTPEEKNQISHRRIALEKMKRQLRQL